MENDYEKAQGLCDTLLRAQHDMYGTNDPRLMDTLIRIAKISQLRKEHNAPRTNVATASDVSSHPLTV
jgi:hypothetical protein